MTVIEEAWVAPMAGPPSQDDIAAIEACVRDYYEGWFAGDGERMARAVHPALAKRAFAQDRDRTPMIDETNADETNADADADADETGA